MRQYSVRDPFLGTGTTGVVCATELLEFYGGEKDSKLAQAAKERIAKAYKVAFGINFFFYNLYKIFNFYFRSSFTGNWTP